MLFKHLFTKLKNDKKYIYNTSHNVEVSLECF